MGILFVPEIRIMATPPIPGGVEMAQIVLLFPFNIVAKIILLMVSICKL